jgi:hypothetical protein
VCAVVAATSAAIAIAIAIAIAVAIAVAIAFTRSRNHLVSDGNTQIQEFSIALHYRIMNVLPSIKRLLFFFVFFTFLALPSLTT